MSPTAGPVRGFDVAVGRRGSGSPALPFIWLWTMRRFLGMSLAQHSFIMLISGAEIIFALVAVHAIGHSCQPHIMGRGKFPGPPVHLNVAPARPGQVFDKYSGDISGFNSGYRFLKSGRFMVVPVTPSSTTNKRSAWHFS